VRWTAWPQACLVWLILEVIWRWPQSALASVLTCCPWNTCRPCFRKKLGPDFWNFV